ncbi:hypothetical protein [Sulfuracidifex tepidarius]|uniref:Uncharacterized protein n=1 Tax=Sulfuracidifex tepidarius TaxID=1294262 RepID=A0A510DTT2_9CREN|nr:hypothetical protein [Sulfuracidifex tepidarius]BBG23611.1 hypothetical protein IC006_0899 [Sulfuracidifex tepidarius]BBG26357.1 hypothetical protein IC007_0865 [Sulfuracidifex tepidarius]
MEWKITQREPKKAKDVSCTIDELASLKEIRDKLGTKSKQFVMDVLIKHLKENKLTFDDLAKKYSELGRGELESLINLLKEKS